MFFLRSYIYNSIKLSGTHWRSKINFLLNPKKIFILIILCYVLLSIFFYSDMKSKNKKYIKNHYIKFNFNI